MTESLEKEDVEELSLRQAIHLIFDEIKDLREEISEIKHTLVQMNGNH